MTESRPAPEPASVPASELASAPGLLGSYARALLPKPKSAGAEAGHPARQLRLCDRPVDRRRLERYRELCGFGAGGATASGDALPVSYPHLEAFPLAMALMARRDFPLPLLGLVHIENSVQQARPLGHDERLDYLVTVADPAPHAKGTSVVVTAEASDSGGTVVWRSVSSYLRRGNSDAAVGSGAAAPAIAPIAEPDPAGLAVDEDWRLPGNLGRSYAAVSGDRNPIHLHPLTARLFGFPRQIAHGMWTKARCLAALDAAGLLPEAYRVRVEFRAPVLLPADVRLSADPERFQLAGTGDRARTHLRGTIVRLDGEAAGRTPTD